MSLNCVDKDAPKVGRLRPRQLIGARPLADLMELYSDPGGNFLAGGSGISGSVDSHLGGLALRALDGWNRC
jgi:hypothetical protein